MGYEVFVYKFEDGDASHIPEGELESILSKYGAIVQGNFGTEFVSSVGEVCESASIVKNNDGDIIGVTFNRPTIDDSLPKIIFDLLGITNTCFFGPDMEFMQCRNDLGKHLPEGLRECFPNGPQIITEAGESWPLQ